MSPMRRCLINRANTKPTLPDGLFTRRLAFHGHLVRKGGITLDLMTGRLHGTRPRGRLITTWLKDLTTQANISYKESMTLPRDMKKWRGVGNPRRTPDEWVSDIRHVQCVHVVLKQMRGFDVQGKIYILYNCEIHSLRRADVQHTSPRQCSLQLAKCLSQSSDYTLICV